ncbi:MAG: ABC transporter permease [Candidatus Eremiobacteraeota bacterium]|nr:ABC transporter permease [Candidatus Eremiobacteraeota bacterium]
MIAAYLTEALSVLLGKRTRSALTIVGLVIGVAAVIAIQTLGKGTAGAVGGILGGLSERAFSVFPNNFQAAASRAALRVQDIDRVKRTVPNIVEAVPTGGIARQVRAGHRSVRMLIYGETSVRFANTPLRFGRAIGENEIAGLAHVAILSDRAYGRLFPDGRNPVGESIRVGERRYVIVGILERPRTGVIPLPLNLDVGIPYTTYVKEYIRGRTVFGARFIVADVSRMEETEAATVRALVALKRGKVAYQTFDRRTFSAAIDGIFNGLTLVVAMIGAVALVVAGIGILNIMLVSVAERTREIGVRKALGATRGQILLQFFIEALVLSAIGCGNGLAIGLGIGWTINDLVLVRISGFVAPVPWLQSVAIAVGFATLVTLLFGTYPAYRAAKLDPIEALRYE